MSAIRELSPDEIALVSGAGAKGQDNNERSNYGNNNRTTVGARKSNIPNYIYNSPGVAKCASDVYSQMIAGAVTGGLPGMATGLVMGTISGQCLSGSANSTGNGNRAGTNNCSGGSGTGTCKR